MISRLLFEKKFVPQTVDKSVLPFHSVQHLGAWGSSAEPLGNLNTGITEANRILGYKVVRLVDNTNTI